MQWKMAIEGMTCTSCEEHVSHALKEVGATKIEASFRKGEARFEAPEKFSKDTYEKSIQEAGYEPIGWELLKAVEKADLAGDSDYDLIVIGSGGGAFAAAIEATQKEAKVLMVERGVVGGTCVNIGCVPSKTLLRAAEIYYTSGHNPFIGLKTRAEGVDMKTLIAGKDDLVGELRQKKYKDLIADYGFDYLQGEASFVDEKTITVNGKTITAERFIVATGARPLIPNIPGLSNVAYLTSTTALSLETVPNHLVVIGSGYIAMELGQLFRHLGAKVTLIQRGKTFLSEYEPEVREVMEKVFAELGIELVRGVTYQKVWEEKGMQHVLLDIAGDEQTISGDALLVAAGRAPNTEALQLTKAGVNIGSRGEIVVSEHLQSSNPRIYAAGDVTMGPQFVYVAAYEGKIAAQNALSKEQIVADLSVVPGVTFTHPSIATVGLTEKEAEAEGFTVDTSVLPLDAVTRAIVNLDTQGVFKMVANKEDGRILGTSIVAENAGDVIYAAQLAVKYGLTVADLLDTLAPYLTMSEGLKLTALTFNKDVNKLSCCAG